MSDYVEVVLQGSKEYVRGFLDGYICAKGSDEAYYFNAECGVKAESLSERLQEIASLEDKYQHILMANALYEALPEAAAGESGRHLCGLPFVSAHAIQSGHFAFDIKTSSRPEAAAVKKAIDARRPQLELTSFKESEGVDKDAKGVELYARVHEYQYKASGVFSGAIIELINLRRALADHSIVHAKDIRLEYDKA